jgi:hypothetical protein
MSSNVIDLSQLTPAQGFIIQGDVAGDRAGDSVSSAGDINGDGFADLIVGAPLGDNGGNYAGEAYVIFGKAGATRTNIDLTFLFASDGFIIQGDAANDVTGSSVSGAGDINGDGLADLIVSAGGGGSRGANTGGAYVIYGKVGATRTNIDLTTLAASDGFYIQGDVAGDAAGGSVSSAGDINGDGLADLIVGAPGGDDGGSYAGEAYVIFGKAGATRANIDLASLAASDGFIIQGDAAGDHAGSSVSSAGDINGDGFADLIVGAQFGDDGGANAGEAYVIFGKTGATRTVIDLTSLAASDGFIIQGDAAGDYAGRSISSAGDINGDGLADLIVGVPNSDDGKGAYVIFGKAGATRTAIDLTSLVASDGFIIRSDGTGSNVASAGDINGDGFADLIVGAPFGSNGGTFAGEAYVIFGKAVATRTSIDLTSLAASDGFIIQGDVERDFAGFSVSSAGDINGDGFADLIVGAPYGDNGGDAAGEAYVIYGRADIGSVKSVRNDFNGDGRSDVLWRNVGGQLSQWLGGTNGGLSDNFANVNQTVDNDWKIAGTADFNGDGRADILWRNVSGQLSEWLGTANGGFTNNGGVVNQTVGNDWKIAGTADFNGDGRADILWRNDNGQLSQWLGNTNGGFTGNGGIVNQTVGNDWKIAGTADFNGDSFNDILWRNVSGQLSQWVGTANGGFTGNGGVVNQTVGNDWKIAGTADFNGDGFNDILWRNVSGQLSQWLGTASGGFTGNGGVVNQRPGTDWKIAGTGDYNGDGRADILWRNDSGQLGEWLGGTNGGFTGNSGIVNQAVPLDWQILSQDYQLI